MKKIFIILLITLMLLGCSNSNNNIHNDENNGIIEKTNEEIMIGTWIFLCDDTSLNFGETFSLDGTVTYFNKKGDYLKSTYEIDDKTITIDGIEFKYKIINENEVEMSFNDSIVKMKRGKEEEILLNEAIYQTQIEKDFDAIVGSWKLKIKNETYFFNFFRDWTASFSYNGSISNNGEWDVSENNIMILEIDELYALPKYELSNNNKTLTLRFDTGEIWVLSKVA